MPSSSASSRFRRDTGSQCKSKRFFLAAITLALGLAHPGVSQTAGNYQINPILSDGYATAPVVDPNFINPWGFNNVGTFWINASTTGLSYVNGTNGVVKLKAIVPAASGTGTGKPTGIVKNTVSAAFVLPNGSAALFIFGTLDGTISGWNGSLGGTLPSLIMVNNSMKNAVYTDIALDPSANGTVLLATNFGAGAKVEAYTSSFAPTTLAGTFTDPNVPTGYAPYAIHVISNQIYVTYMLRSTSTVYGSSGSPSYSETLGVNTGFISVFDLNGNYIARAITGGNLNAPWGMALAPSSFGPFGGDLLVGNLGDGLINVYNPTTYAYLGQLTDATAKPILYSLPGAGIANSYVGLWEINFGQGTATGLPAIANAGDPAQLYFAAGLDAEQHGLFGSISNVAPIGGNTNFALSTSSPVLTVKGGSTGTATLAIAPINGFAGTVTFTCSGMPVNSTCTFSPSTVTATGTAPATTTLTLTTNVATSSLRTEPLDATRSLVLAILPGGILLFSLVRRRRNAGALRLLVLMLTAAAGTALIVGCASSSTPKALPTTPSGNATIKVTASSGAVSQATNISLIVQ